MMTTCSAQHPVVFDVGPHRQRCRLLAAVEEHRRARHAHQRRLVVPKAVDELAQRTLSLCPCARDDSAALLPRCHHRERRDRDEQREPRAVHQLGQIRGEEHQIHQQQQAAADDHRPQRPSPPGPRVVKEQGGGDGDRARHRHAVGVRQRRGAAEREDEDQHRHHQHAVDPRHVDLADRRRRRVLDAQQRQIAELCRLRRDRERPGDHRLRGDDRRRRGQQHHRNPRPLRGEQEERRAHLGLVGKHQRTLPEVAQREAGSTTPSQPSVIARLPKWPMSAYSASAPVTDRTIAAREKNAM